MARRKRTKWVQLIAACALLVMLAPYAQQTDKQAWLSTALQVSAASAKAPAAPVREEASSPDAEPDAVRTSLSDSVSVELATKR